MNKKTITLLIVSVVLLAAAAGIVYVFVLKEVNAGTQYDDQIKGLKSQLSLGADRNQKLSQAEQSLAAVDWPSKKAKIDANFISTPFYLSEIEYFFKQTIARSKMSLSTLSFAGPTSINGGGQSDNGKVQPVTKTVDGESTAPAKTSGSGVFSGIQGPVKATTVAINVSGTYEQFKGLLKIFESQAYLISVKSISFAGGTAISSYNITAEIYSY